MVKHLGDVHDAAERLDSRAGRRGRDASGNVPEHVLARCFVRFERRLSVASGWAMMRDVSKVSVSTSDAIPTPQVRSPKDGGSFESFYD